MTSAPVPAGGGSTPRGNTPEPAADLLARAAEDPTGLADGDYAALLDLRGDDLDRLCAVADELRRAVVGATVGLVVNRNLGSDRCSDPQLAAAVAADAWELGCTELCIQGTASPDAGDHVYEDLARAVKRAAPGMHLHAFRPADVVDGARRADRTLRDHLMALRDAGVDTVPGTGVKILDEGYRAGRFPDDLPVPRWIEAITTAHRLGLRSTSVMFVGHGETGAQRVAHLRTLRRLQDDTGGFTEFVPMLLPGTPLTPATLDDARAVHAVARLVLHGSINHHQAAWTRLGTDGAAAALWAGADDLGGTLLDGRVAPELGVEHGRELPIDTARALARGVGRSLRLRTTTYGVPEHP